MNNEKPNIMDLLKNEKVELKALGEVCEIQRGRVISKAYLEENKGEYSVYSSQTANNGEIGKIDTYDFEGEYATWTTDGAYAGTAFYRNGKFSITNICGLISPKNHNKLLVKFIVYWMQENAKKYVTGGSGNPKLMSNVVSRIQIPIPSIETQEKIVKILDKFTNYVTELQTELQKRTYQYEFYRDKLLNEKYLQELSKKIDNFESNRELRVTTLGEVAKVSRGASPRPISRYITESEDGIPWIKIGDTNTLSKYIFDTKQRITIEGAEKSRIVKKGDFIISNSMSFGRPYIVGVEKGAIHDGWATISEYERYLDSEFLYYYLSFHSVQRYWERKLNSSSVSNLNSEIIQSLPIPIVDKKIQNIVVQILDKFQKLVMDTKGLLPKEIEQRRKQYEYYREKLLIFDSECGRPTDRPTDFNS